MPSVFLSYDHEDVGIARPIAKALEKAGHTVWYDRHIDGGAQYSRRIEEELDSAETVVVLWSAKSLDSAWVRDEAAEGRDREKLVPLTLGGVTAPIGFRQFQTIPLGDWGGRGKVPHLDDLLRAIGRQSSSGRPAAVATAAPLPMPMPRAKSLTSDRRWLLPGVAALVLIAGGIGAWNLLGTKSLPVVQVAAANGASGSQAAATDLFIKLGSLAQVGQGKWKLVDVGAERAEPDFIFRTADIGSADKPQGSLILLDGHDNSLLWSRDFVFPAGHNADLRQQVSLTAGRVLGCALESRAAGGLRRDLLRLYLSTCSSIAETSFDAPSAITGPLRRIVTARPDFEPAWGKLIASDIGVLDLDTGAGTPDQARATLRRDILAAKKVAPDLPEISLGEARLLPPTQYARLIDLLDRAAAAAPDNTEILSAQVGALVRTGRMFEAANAARRAAENDPLSPTATTQLILVLAYASQFDKAREELGRAERLWVGTAALRDAQWSYHFRYGDPRLAKQYASFNNEGLDFYFAARVDPSPANIERLVALFRPFAADPDPGTYGYAVQAFAEFGLFDDLFNWIANAPTDVVASGSYLLFRPSFTKARHDPRFVAVVKRIGLSRYWRESGRFPDFCSSPDLPYRCQDEFRTDG